MSGLRHPTGADVVNLRIASQNPGLFCLRQSLWSADPGPAGFDFGQPGDETDAMTDGDSPSEQLRERP